MTSQAPRRAVELFHLHFCRVLASGEHRSHFVVKGGCNLRFFFDGIRYSEDLDLDVAIGAPATVKRRVDKLLASPALLLPLRAAGVTPLDLSAPKQTETTQRWKLGLRVEGLGPLLRTKIELSRRARPRDVRIEAVGALAAVHRMPPPVLAHYAGEEAISQKIQALAGRTEVQARDLFDLSWLFARVPEGTAIPIARTVVQEARDRAAALTPDAFDAQVLPFLEADRRGEFEGPEAWASVRGGVLRRLEELGG